jgi:heterodisulfide reductase subunit C
MAETELDFKKRLENILSGELYKRCFQCGACAADCPAARYSKDKFNPRVIMQNTSLGLEGLLEATESVIWLCTNCYTCYDRCPQDVRPIEVILAIKNYLGQISRAPDEVKKISESFKNTGRTVAVSDAINRRRQQLGLEPLKPINMEEINKLMQ